MCGVSGYFYKTNYHLVCAFFSVILRVFVCRGVLFVLAGKRALIVGLMSDRSIAYGIADRMHSFGAQLGFSYLERFDSRVKSLTQEWDPFLYAPCDLSCDNDIARLVETVANSGDKLDVLVHSVAFAPRDHLDGDFLKNLTREGMHQSHDVSSHSFALLAKALLPYMNDNASIITLTYLGSVRAMPNYNIMGVAKASLECSVRYMAAACGSRGIRVNAVSPGPIKTASAAGIKGLREMIDHVASISPIAKPIDIQQVGNTCAFLASDLASGITGSTIYVDHGYHTCAV